MCAAAASMTGGGGETWISPENRAAGDQIAKAQNIPPMLRGFYSRAVPGMLQNQQSKQEYMENPNSYTVKYYDT